jgi:hypothetical protein
VAQHPLRRGILEGDPVVLVDGPVAVLVHIHRKVGARALGVDREPVVTPLVLEDVKGVDRHSRLEDLNEGADSAGNIADQNPGGRPGNRIDAGQLVAVARSGKVGAPA